MAAAPQPETPTPARIVAGELVRLGWMLFGFLTILTMAMSLVAFPAWSLGWRDGGFWAAVAITALFRHVDISRFNGETAGGKPATMRDLRRYLVGLAVISCVLWVLVQSVQL